MATFGLSFCLGPVSGSYIAAEYGSHTVFLLALLLLVLNVVYIILYLPETVKTVNVSDVTLPYILALTFLAQLPNYSTLSPHCRSSAWRWSTFPTLGTSLRRSAYSGSVNISYIFIWSSTHDLTPQRGSIPGHCGGDCVHILHLCGEQAPRYL